MIGELIKILLLIVIFIAFIYYPDENDSTISPETATHKSENLGQYIKLKSWLDKEGNTLYDKLDNNSTKILDLKSRLIGE